MITGKCLCGSVTWAAGGPFTPLSHCHCSMCRKAHGAPFATFTSCAAEDFEWTSDQSTVRQYWSSADFVRAFCGTCGSAVPQARGDGRIRLPVGCTAQPSGLGGGRHIFSGSRASWHSMGGPTQQYDAYPPGMEGRPPVAQNDPAPGDPPEDVLRGSCLCGTVRFEVLEPFSVVHNCHCSRCRRARSAAHATNGFVSFDALRFTAGADNVTTYMLPGTGFGQAFCDTCGSGLPRKNAQRGIANVPLAALDDDPQHRPDDHIFVGSMADWYSISDDIVQFEEGPG